MKRVFSNYAYGTGPRSGCWWDDTIAAPDWPQLTGDIEVDVAVVGGGFTGISAALRLAEAGVSVAVLEAGTPGFGASGRNGGFCCLGGSKLDGAAMARTHGRQAAAEWLAAQLAAVDLVAALLERFGIDADRHSNGETRLAHRPGDMKVLRREADALIREGGPAPTLTEAQDLAAAGLGGPFHGALTIPVGFGLNPRKYLFGIAGAAQAAGALLFQQSRVNGIKPAGRRHRLCVDAGSVTCDTVLIATNGYSSDDLPDWLAGRYIPAQSTVLVTRPLSDAELDAQGWTSDQMAYDTRFLLHYFRLMPNRRFLFGMRGGLFSSPSAERAVRARTRAHFEAMFPAWRDVPSANMWSGMVCLARNRVPFVGPVPGQPGLFASLAYHGNGVAMGSYCGRLLADLALGRPPDLPYPAPMRVRMRKFPLGRARRLLMLPVYAGLALRDR